MFFKSRLGNDFCKIAAKISRVNKKPKIAARRNRFRFLLRGCSAIHSGTYVVANRVPFLPLSMCFVRRIIAQLSQLLRQTVGN